MEEEKINMENSENELERTIKERDEYLEGWKRAKADFVNYKKDENKRFEELVKFGQEGMMREILSVLDSFDLALAAVSVQKDGNDLMEKGFELIRSQLQAVLARYGLEPIKITPGDKFNPEIHDAISVEESDKESGAIVEEVEKGYLLNGRLLRAAKVKVVK